MNYVILNGTNYSVIEGKLNLNNQGVQYLTDIEYIETLIDLKSLDLQHNQIIWIDGIKELQNLKELELNDNKITSISGLETLENLEILILSNNQIFTISGLNNLRNLKKLSLYKNQISEIIGLDKLENLEELTLDSNQITTIKNLNNLKRLKKLLLNSNRIQMIAGLENLTNLEILDVSNNKIQDIRGLENLNKLKYLIIENNLISKGLIEQLGGVGKYGVQYPQNFVKFCRNDYVIYNNKYYFVENVKEPSGFRYIKNVLNLQGKKIKNISEIKNIENLIHLEGLLLDNNDISEIKGLENLKNLKLLWLSYNEIKQINGLDKLIQLKWLNFNKNKIENIEGLKNLINLEILTIQNNNIKEIQGLDNLCQLESLSLNGNKIEKINGLDKLKKLKELFLSKNQKIIELNGLYNLSSLEVISLSDAQILEIKNLDNLLNLKKFDLGNNQITKIQGLSQLKNLEFLRLNDNKISEIIGLENLTKLTHIELEHNKIESEIFNALNINYNPLLFVSYCILKPVLKNIKNKIIWSELMQKNQYLQKLNFNYLKSIIKLFPNIEISKENDNISSIITYDHLVFDLNHFLTPRSEKDDIEYELISQELKIKDLESTKKFIDYVLEHNLSKHIIYKTTNGIKKSGIEKLRHQLAIYDTLNQTSMIASGVYESYIKGLEHFITSNKLSSIHTFKFAFVNNESFKNSGGIPYLENLGWNLIFFSKGKKSDYDSDLQTFIGELSLLNSKGWSKIFLITADLKLIDHFRKNYINGSDIELFIIAKKEDLHLMSYPNLEYLKNENFDFNIFKSKV